jgi:maltokinase
MAERLELPAGFAVHLDHLAGEWQVALLRADGAEAGPGDGASLALLALLRGEDDLGDQWQALRLAAIPEADGERAVLVDQTNTSVVVGETLVVKWLRSVADQPHPALAALAQLSAVGFARTPTAYTVLTWTSPSGHTLPIAYVTDFLTGAEDGWTWCVDLVRAAGRSDHDAGLAAGAPERLGALTAELHVALATPNHVFPRPVQPAGASRAQRWYDGAFAMLESAIGVTDQESAALVKDGAEAISRCFDEGLGDDDRLAQSPVQHIHGDLHVGQVLSWSEGLAIVDFDGNPVAAPGGGLLHPAARDVAQMIRSLDLVGQIVLHRSPELDAGPVREWMVHSRERFLGGYRDGLRDTGMSLLLDERLLLAFEVEQLLRELVYADRHLPRWAYAPQGGLRDLLRDLPPDLP